MRVEREVWEGHQMQSPQRLDYLGALIKQEQRLVLVPMDPDKPWDAFRKMRSWMRTAKKQAEVDVFASPEPLRNAAEIVSLDAWRGRAEHA